MAFALARLFGRRVWPWAYLLLACTPQKQPLTTTPMQAAPTLGKAPASNEAQTPGALPPPSVAYVRETTALRREPSLNKALEPTGHRGKPRANVLAFLQRGEALVVLQEQNDFLQARSSDEQIGWVRAAALRTGEQVQTATCVQAVPCFVRPDLLALDPCRTIPAGSLLFVLRDKEAFLEIDAGPPFANTVWVLADTLERSSVEVEAAKLYGRAQSLQARDPAAAEALLALLRARFAASRLVQRLLPAPAGETALTPPPPTDPAASDDEPDVDALGAPLQPSLAPAANAPMPLDAPR